MKIQPRAFYASTSGCILWFGNSTRPEFAPLLAFLQRYVPVQCLETPDSLSKSILRKDVSLVIVAMPASRSLTAANLEWIADRYPAATIVEILSAWHERSRQTVSTHERVHRVPWHALCGWWTSKFGMEVLDSNAINSTELVLFPSLEPAPLNIAVIAAHAQIAESHESMFRAHGMEAHWLVTGTRWTQLDRYDAFLWDESAYGRSQVAPLATCQQAVGGRMILAIRSAANILAPVEQNVFSVGQPYLVEELVSLIRFHTRQVPATSTLARTA